MTDQMAIIEALYELGLSRKEAVKALADMKKQVLEGANPVELLYDIGLEGDYVLGLI